MQEWEMPTDRKCGHGLGGSLECLAGVEWPLYQKGQGRPETALAEDGGMPG